MFSGKFPNPGIKGGAEPERESQWIRQSGEPQEMAFASQDGHVSGFLAFS